MDDLRTSHQLLARAFRAAQESGKEQWWSMTLPVLKNRLLQITRGSFKEADFGAISFRDYLQKNVDVISLDDTQPPGMVTFRQADHTAAQPKAPKSKKSQLRPDLWNAIMDFKSGKRYFWSVSLGEAVFADDGDEELLLPTLSESEFKSWRSEFVTQVNPQGTAAVKTADWLAKGLPTTALPSFLQPQWNRLIKHKITDRLKSWFESRSLPAPKFITDVNSETSPDVETEDIREFLLEVIKQMTKDELVGLHISPRAALRIRRSSDR